MREQDLFREFRSGVAPPSEIARERASARLAAAVGAEAAPRNGVAPLVVRRSRHTALTLAAVAAGVSAVLFLSAPWHDSPGFIERAQAAMTPPAGTVLHYKWTQTMTSPDCTVTRGPNEIWVDQVPPYRYRATLDDPPVAVADPLSCPRGTRREVGGTVEPDCSPAEQINCVTEDTLKFVEPNKLSVSPLRFVLPPDPVTMLREAIKAGNVDDEGTIELDGRTVERLRIDDQSACAFPSCAPGYVYVDPETFRPVELHTMGTTATSEGTTAQFGVVDRYLDFEYLPRTVANLALTDIQAQHPDAAIVDPEIPGDE
jgi:hypothetical protein